MRCNNYINLLFPIKIQNSQKIDEIYYLSERMDGDLTQLIYYDFDILQKIHIFEQMVHSIKCLHDNNSVHGDIKPNNFLYKIQDDKSFLIRIADYDSSYMLDQDNEGECIPGGKQWYRKDGTFKDRDLIAKEKAKNCNKRLLDPKSNIYL